MDHPQGYEPVTAVEHDGEVTWQVFSQDRGPDNLMTAIRITSGSRSATPGFGGPALLEGTAINFWYGRHDGLPAFVAARVDAAVAAVTIETTRRKIVVDTSNLAVHFGLRFVARPLSSDEDLVAVYVDADEPRRAVHSLTDSVEPVAGAGWQEFPAGPSPARDAG